MRRKRVLPQVPEKLVSLPPTDEQKRMQELRSRMDTFAGRRIIYQSRGTFYGVDCVIEGIGFLTIE